MWSSSYSANRQVTTVSPMSVSRMSISQMSLSHMSLSHMSLSHTSLSLMYLSTMSFSLMSLALRCARMARYARSEPVLAFFSSEFPLLYSIHLRH
jgi:hypothetical protein